MTNARNRAYRILILACIGIGLNLGNLVYQFFAEGALIYIVVSLLLIAYCIPVIMGCGYRLKRTW